MYIRPIYTNLTEDSPEDSYYEDFYEVGAFYGVDGSGEQVKLEPGIILSSSEIAEKGIELDPDVEWVKSDEVVTNWAEYTKVIYYTYDIDEARELLKITKFSSQEPIVVNPLELKFQAALWIDALSVRDKMTVLGDKSHNIKLLAMPLRHKDTHSHAMYEIHLVGKVSEIGQSRSEISYTRTEQTFITSYFLLGYSIEFLAVNTLRSSESIINFLKLNNLLPEIEDKSDLIDRLASNQFNFDIDLDWIRSLISSNESPISILPVNEQELRYIADEKILIVGYPYKRIKEIADILAKEMMIKIISLSKEVFAGDYHVESELTFVDNQSWYIDGEGFDSYAWDDEIFIIVGNNKHFNGSDNLSSLRTQLRITTGSPYADDLIPF